MGKGKKKPNKQPAPSATTASPFTSNVPPHDLDQCPYCGGPITDAHIDVACAFRRNEDDDRAAPIYSRAVMAYCGGTQLLDITLSMAKAVRWAPFVPWGPWQTEVQLGATINNIVLEFELSVQSDRHVLMWKSNHHLMHQIISAMVPRCARGAPKLHLYQDAFEFMIHHYCLAEREGRLDTFPTFYRQAKANVGDAFGGRVSSPEPTFMDEIKLLPGWEELINQGKPL